MKARLTYLVHKLRESFWFLPTLMTLGAVALSVLTLNLDSRPPFALVEAMPWTQGLGPTNARLIMSTIAGSMITAASLVFSLTLVSLTLASAQLGPRLLSMFMRDRMTQVVLGAFIATFVFALLVLTSLGENGDPGIIPSVSIGTALLFTLLSFGLLISFIHHLASSLQADVIVARVAQDLGVQLSRVFGAGESRPESRDEPENWHDDATQILSRTGGYVQAIDCDALVNVASVHDTEIRLQYRPGHFVCEGETVAQVQHRSPEFDAITNEICGAIVFGPKRTQTDDPEFAFQAIVEIGLRALSSGINDPYTAITCIDRLGEALVRAFRGDIPNHVFRDAEGKVRVRAVPLTFEGLVNTAFNELRQSAAGNAAVLIRLAETLGRLANFAMTTEQRGVIRHHAGMLARSCDRSIADERDREVVHERLRALESALS